MALDDLALTIEDKRVGDELYAQGAHEVAVGVEQHLVVPTGSVDHRLHLLCVLRLIYAHSDEAHSRLVLPVGVDLADSFEFAVAGLTPCGKEADDEGAPVVAERGGIDGLAVDVLELYRGDLRTHLLRHDYEHNNKRDPCAGCRASFLQTEKFHFG